MEIAHHIFPIHRVHLGLLPTRPSPVTYMYVVSAKIPCLPSKLSLSHSYCQHGHDDISKTCGVVDRDRLSYFPMHRVHLVLLSTRPSPVTYMYVVSAKILVCPQNCLLLIATVNTVTVVSRKPVGWLMEIAYHILPLHRVHLGLLPTRPSPVTCI